MTVKCSLAGKMYSISTILQLLLPGNYNVFCNYKILGPYSNVRLCPSLTFINFQLDILFGVDCGYRLFKKMCRSVIIFFTLFVYVCNFKNILIKSLIISCYCLIYLQFFKQKYGIIKQYISIQAVAKRVLCILLA